MKAKGLGDTIEQITTATGIKALVHSIFGDDCGCDERKAYLNKLFPYQNVECLTEEEYIYLSSYNFGTATLDVKSQAELLKIYNRVFNLKHQPTSCGTCWRDIISKLETVYNEYKNK